MTLGLIMAVPTPAKIMSRCHARRVIIAGRPCSRPTGGVADQATPPAPADLLAVFARLADPRRRGVCHRLGVILTLAMCAVLAGALPLPFSRAMLGRASAWDGRAGPWLRRAGGCGLPVCPVVGGRARP
jgi:hypothetical protein